MQIGCKWSQFQWIKHKNNTNHIKTATNKNITKKPTLKFQNKDNYFQLLLPRKPNTGISLLFRS